MFGSQVCRDEQYTSRDHITEALSMKFSCKNKNEAISQFCIDTHKTRRFGTNLTGIISETWAFASLQRKLKCQRGYETTPEKSHHSNSQYIYFLLIITMGMT